MDSKTYSPLIYLSKPDNTECCETMLFSDCHVR